MHVMISRFWTSPARQIRQASFWSCVLATAILTVLAATGTTSAESWETGPGYRRMPLHAPVGAGEGFSLIRAGSIGIHFTNTISAARVQANQNAMNGSGVAAGDFDNDGWCDLFFCNKDGASGLFRNLGNGNFADVTVEARAGCTNQVSAGAVFADINGDGFQDLMVSSFGGPNVCLLNDGKGHFTDITQAAGLVGQTGSTSMALADLDGDGDLDLYLCNFGVISILRDGGRISTRMLNGKPVVTGRYANRLKIIDGFLTEFGEPDILYWNDGKGHFTPADWPSTFTGEDGKPAVSAPDFGLAVQIRDINGDGLPDIYVCNDFQTPDRIWINSGGGKFKAIETAALRNMSFASMGVDFADIDRDGHLDFITVEMLSRNHAHHLQQSSPMRPVLRIPGQGLEREDMPRNTLYRNRGDGTYDEIAHYAGVAASDWSWTPIFLDVDLDGYEDLLISNGHMRDVNFRDVNESGPIDATRAVQETKSNLNRYPVLNSPKYAYRNRGNLTFEDVSDRWGFNSTLIAHGMCLLDLDHDGDLDVILNTVNAEPLVYRNNCVKPRIAIRLKGLASNASGIGARITVTAEGLVKQTQEMIAGGRYLSGDENLRVFAAASSTSSLSVEVVWRSGQRSVLENAQPGFLYEINESESKPAAPPKLPPIKPWFNDATSQLAHQHHQTAFDDFAIQPLLPRKLSQLGPGVAFMDVNKDGHEDLFIGSGQGGSPALLLGNGRGGFQPFATPLPIAADDQGGSAAYRDSQGKAVFLTALANYRNRDASRPPVQSHIFDKNALTAGPAVGKVEPGISAGCIALGDMDGDGDLDLFVGGRFRAGHYPEETHSAVYKNTKGVFEIDTVNTEAIKSASLVVSAVWTDLNSDGYPDLVLTCDWGPIRVYTNERGTLREKTRELGLETLRGWWTGVVAGDWDGDGKLDLLVGNYGLNGSQTIWGPLPYAAYYGDFAQENSLQIIEAFHDPILQKIVPFRDFSVLRSAIPSLRSRIESHAQYSRMSVQEILGDDFSKAKRAEVNTLTTCLFLNRGDHFTQMPLPREAQWAPVFGVLVADVNNDGYEDAFLSQNCFALRSDDTRQDSGRGLWLLGDGKGQFQQISGSVSGVRVYGEQRGCAVADVNEDGRVDLVVTENGGPTHLFINQSFGEGLRIRLQGPPENRAGAGAQLRIQTGEAWSPLRETHAGSGYGSQDGEVQVMAKPTATSRLHVRWPGGKMSVVEVPAGAKELVVPFDQAAP